MRALPRRSDKARDRLKGPMGRMPRQCIAWWVQPETLTRCSYDTMLVARHTYRSCLWAPSPH